MNPGHPEPGWATKSEQATLGPAAPPGRPGTLDRLLIGERIARYGWAFDERQRDALAECFTADGVWQGLIMGRDRVGPVRGPGDIAAWLAGFWEHQQDQRRHVFTNLVVTAQCADEAEAHAYLVLLGTHGATTTTVSAGPYRFRLRRCGDGIWRIAELSAGFDAPF
jgi:hypothetical protein